jgi:hypothetical protein
MLTGQDARQDASKRNVLHLRLDARLRERLQQEADKHHFTLTNEIRIRLLDSFDRDVMRGLDDITRDMEVCWLRFSTRFLRMQLSDELADAVLKGETPEKLRGLAQLIVSHRGAEQRVSQGGVS